MSNTSTGHLDAATLMAFAAGTLVEPLAAAAASHIVVCPACAAQARDMDLIGSSLMGAMQVEAFEARPLPPPTLRPANSTVVQFAAVGHAKPVASSRLPEPIARRYGLTYDTIPWRILVPGVWHHRLPLSTGVEGDLRLLKIAAGIRMPEHGHGGAELTVVLDGAYADETGSFKAGDIQDVADETEHQPMADRELGCVCLIASERPARFKSLIGRMMQPWTGM